MLTFRKTLTFYYGIMLVLLTACLFLELSYWWALLPTAIFLGIVAYGSIAIQSQFHLNAICKIPAATKQIVLTFDDGPHPEHTPAILDLLQEFDVKATFFCIGAQAAKHPDLVRRIDREGHILANHSYHHGWLFDLKGPKLMRRELLRTNYVIHEITGNTMRLFRPPYGVTNPSLASAVRTLGFTTIGWSLRTLDTVITDPDKVYQRIISKLQPGDIILFHDTQPGTVFALRQLLEYSAGNDHTITLLHESIDIEPYA